MSKLSRDKGARIEREIVAAHEALGIKSERVTAEWSEPVPGQRLRRRRVCLGPDGAPLVCEVKARASGKDFTTIERWHGEADASKMIGHGMSEVIAAGPGQLALEARILTASAPTEADRAGTARDLGRLCQGWDAGQ